ncbi:hypothetical protein CALCODRAFT_184729 [Calocera cornea HHB12733]|uniref:Uncharacterized protein n=1 Tax=Calocera cornea HHB12733 TaxID=1353952 RepID=A0A165CA89_9BASI|nr:hypothetical protein CALCODRAFT_184729 [Calocera cornea HHB12733]
MGTHQLSGRLTQRLAKRGQEGTLDEVRQAHTGGANRGDDTPSILLDALNQRLYWHCSCCFPVRRRSSLFGRLRKLSIVSEAGRCWAPILQIGQNQATIETELPGIALESLLSLRKIARAYLPYLRAYRDDTSITRAFGKAGSGVLKHEGTKGGNCRRTLPF